MRANTGTGHGSTALESGRVTSGDVALGWNHADLARTSPGTPNSAAVSWRADYRGHHRATTASSPAVASFRVHLGCLI